MGNACRWLFLVFLLSILLPGEVIAAEEGTVKVGITPSPLAVSVFAPREVIEHRPFTVRAQIQNLGDGRITGAVATIYLDEDGLSLGTRKAERYIGTIRPHGVRTVLWLVEPIETGNYVVLVLVSGNGVPGELTAQDSVIITVKERHRFFDFFWRLWQHLFGGWR